MSTTRLTVLLRSLQEVVLYHPLRLKYNNYSLKTLPDVVLIVKLLHDKPGVFKSMKLMPVIESGLHGDTHREKGAEFTTELLEQRSCKDQGGNRERSVQF